jgi:hypothetical protein
MACGIGVDEPQSAVAGVDAGIEHGRWARGDAGRHHHEQTKYDKA